MVHDMVTLSTLEPLRETHSDSEQEKRLTVNEPLTPEIPKLMLQLTDSPPFSARRRLSRTPTELTLTKEELERGEQQYRKSLLQIPPLDVVPATPRHKNFVELSKVPVSGSIRRNIRHHLLCLEATSLHISPRNEDPKVRKENEEHFMKLMDSLEPGSPTGSQEMINVLASMKQVLNSYSNQLGQYESGVEKRVQAEIRKREEVERKLEEKIEENRIPINFACLHARHFEVRKTIS